MIKVLNDMKTLSEFFGERFFIIVRKNVIGGVVVNGANINRQVEACI